MAWWLGRVGAEQIHHKMLLLPNADPVTGICWWCDVTLMVTATGQLIVATQNSEDQKPKLQQVSILEVITNHNILCF